MGSTFVYLDFRQCRYSPHTPLCPAMHYLPPSRASGINIRSCISGASLPAGLGLVPFSTDISRGAPGQLSLGSEGRNVEHIGCKLHHCPASCLPAGQAAQAVRQSISFSNFMSPPLKSYLPIKTCLFVCSGATPCPLPRHPWSLLGWLIFVFVRRHFLKNNEDVRK